MGKKFIAVRTGRRTGVFEGWDSCKHLVLGVPYSCYKGFNTRQDAEKFLLSKFHRSPTSTPTTTPQPNFSPLPPLPTQQTALPTPARPCRFCLDTVPGNLNAHELACGGLHTPPSSPTSSPFFPPLPSTDKLPRSFPAISRSPSPQLPSPPSNNHSPPRRPSKAYHQDLQLLRGGQRAPRHLRMVNRTS
eukprot:Lithocolla_globosa_v1_NODE_1175_length_2811_cov_32.185776.p2 type:complete len:189 gc:universal NODE_1175_length_2811_cov_32.185776:1102-1668(+)